MNMNEVVLSPRQTASCSHDKPHSFGGRELQPPTPGCTLGLEHFKADQKEANILYSRGVQKVGIPMGPMGIPW